MPSGAYIGSSAQNARKACPCASTITRRLRSKPRLALAPATAPLGRAYGRVSIGSPRPLLDRLAGERRARCARLADAGQTRRILARCAGVEDARHQASLVLTTRLPAP